MHPLRLRRKPGRLVPILPLHREPQQPAQAQQLALAAIRQLLVGRLRLLIAPGLPPRLRRQQQRERRVAQQPPAPVRLPPRRPGIVRRQCDQRAVHRDVAPHPVAPPAPIRPRRGRLNSHAEEPNCKIDRQEQQREQRQRDRRRRLDHRPREPDRERPGQQRHPPRERDAQDRNDEQGQCSAHQRAAMLAIAARASSSARA